MARKAIVDRDTVLRMLRDGQTTQHVANHFGVSRQAVDLHRKDFIARGLITDQRAARSRGSTATPTAEATSTQPTMAKPTPAPSPRELAALPLDQIIDLAIDAFAALKRLPEAAFRPGRFDEWRQIKKLDDKIIDKMIGDDVPAKYRKVLAEMPIAYIFEFHERADAIGRETAISEIHELAARTKLLHKLHRSETRDTFRPTRTILARAKRAERQAESAEKAAERYRKTADRLEKAAPLLATQAKRLHEQADKQAKKKAVRKAKKKTRKGTKRRAKKRPKGNAEPASSLTEEEALNMSDMAVELASADDDDEPSHVYGVDLDDLEGQNDPEE